MDGEPTRRARLSDVARAAGVSQATVSNLLSGTARVADETAARVLAAVEELHYVPSAAARSLRTGRARGVLVVADEGSDPARIGKAVLDLQARRGVPVMVLVDGFLDVDAEEAALGPTTVVDLRF